MLFSRKPKIIASNTAVTLFQHAGYTWLITAKGEVKVLREDRLHQLFWHNITDYIAPDRENLYRIVKHNNPELPDEALDVAVDAEISPMYATNDLNHTQSAQQEEMKEEYLALFAKLGKHLPPRPTEDA